MKLAFIGLGKMGSAVAERLLEQKPSLTVYNRTADKAEPRVEKGAKQACTLAEAAENADLILSNLLDDQAALAVTEEIALHMSQAAIHVSLSTILPETSAQLLEIHKKSRTRYVGGAVLGIPDRARDGTLTTFLCGEHEAVERASLVAQCFSNKVLNLGTDIKTANFLKICMNYSLATTIELISELYVFAEKSGFDPSLVAEGLHQIYSHPGFKHYIDKIQKQDFDTVNFDVKGGNKDLKLFQQAFQNAGAKSDLANLIQPRFEEAAIQGLERKDWSCIYKIVQAKK